MDKKIALSVMTIVTAAMLVSLNKPVQPTTFGARSSVEVVWYPSGVDTAYAALKAGDIDMLDWALTRPQKLDAESDPNLQLVACSSNSLWEFDVNNNKTIAEYGSGATSATAIPEVRKAIACVIDKPTAIIANILSYYGLQIDAPVAALQTTGWVDPSVVGVNYPYKQNYTKAVDYLASAGFWGDGTWLHYPNNTAVWGTSAGKSTESDLSGLPVAGSQPLVVVIRITDPLRLACGRYLCSQLDGEDSGPTASVFYANYEWVAWGAKHGEPGLKGGAFGTTKHKYEMPRSGTSPMVMGDRNYNVYTGGWSVGRYPTYEFGLFDTIFWYPYGANYVTGTEWAIGNPNYTSQMDPLLHNIMYAPNLACAKGNCSLFTNFFVTNCVNIPLWSSASYNAWRKELTAITNMQGAGIINDYTFMKAYKTGPKAGTPIIVGEPERWTLMNPLYSCDIVEQKNLARIIGSTMTVNPYNISIDQPWMAQDWQTSTWFDARTNSMKTAVTYWFRKDCGCAAPVTGAFAGNFTAEDFAANMWYTYAYPDCWQWGDTMDINHISVDSAYKATVYFDDNSIWFLYEPTYPMMMPTGELTTDTELCAVHTKSFLGSALTTPPGALPSYKEYTFTPDSVVTIISATKNGGAITEGIDFYVRGGYDTADYGATRQVFVPITTFASTDNITISYYYAIPGAASGTYLGKTMVGSSGVPATLYSYSYVYPVSLSASSSLLLPNPYFFLPTPKLGEIDWRWHWTSMTKPRSGNFYVTDLDVEMVEQAYCHRGDGVYDPKYLPGADIDPSDLCHIGTQDVGSVTGEYEATVASITNVMSNKTVVGQGCCMNVSVVVENPTRLFGSISFNVTVYANTTVIHTFTNVHLSANASATLTFTWDTTNTAKGNYTLSAYVPPFFDTRFVDGIVTVSIVGDVDGDHNVTILDVVKITSIYASKQGDPKFNPNADIDNDGKITILDVVLCTSHYAQKDP